MDISLKEKKESILEKEKFKFLRTEKCTCTCKLKHILGWVSLGGGDRRPFVLCTPISLHLFAQLFRRNFGF